MKTHRNSASRDRAFTLVELMVSTAILAGLMVLLLNTVDQTQRVWTRATAKASQFQAARNGFESMTRRLSQATLNTYWRAYDVILQNPQADLKFRRQSELHFISGPTSEIFKPNHRVQGLSTPEDIAYPTHAIFFQAPLGYTEEKESTGAAATSPLKFRAMDEMLTGCGYFIEYGPDPDRPAFINELNNYPEQKRFRLMELTVPGERLNIFHRYESTDKISRGMIDPRVYDVSNRYYKGLVDDQRKPTSGWLPPIWMVDALIRDPIPGATKGNRFRFAHVRAENVIALVILPKLPPKDRKPPGSENLDLAPNYKFDSWRILAGKPETDPINNRNVDNSARDNMLPPIVQVTMVAVDEPSMKRIEQNDPIPFTKDLFKEVQTEEDYRTDIEALEKTLVDKKLNYRIFSTDVVLRGSKWSFEPKRKGE